MRLCILRVERINAREQEKGGKNPTTAEYFIFNNEYFQLIELQSKIKEIKKIWKSKGERDGKIEKKMIHNENYKNREAKQEKIKAKWVE